MLSREIELFEIKGKIKNLIIKIENLMIKLKWHKPKD